MPHADQFEEPSLRVLHRKMYKTASARFHASQRLRWYHTLTLWSMTGFSTGLLILSVLPAYKILASTSSPAFNFTQFALSLVVLVISLLLSVGNYSDRSEKMHRCGMEINSLAHEILPACQKDDELDLYHRIVIRYNAILEAYENHTQNDFDHVKLNYPDEYQISKREKRWIRAKYFAGFWIHGLLALLLFAAFLFVLLF